MITATVKHNDNYTDIEFPCSEAYLSAKLMEIHVDDLSNTTHYITLICLSTNSLAIVSILCLLGSS